MPEDSARPDADLQDQVQWAWHRYLFWRRRAQLAIPDSQWWDYLALSSLPNDLPQEVTAAVRARAARRHTR